MRMAGVSYVACLLGRGGRRCSAQTHFGHSVADWLDTDAALLTASVQLAHTFPCCQRLQDSCSSGRSCTSGGCPEPVERVPAENGTVHDADAPDGAASPSRWMQADAAEPDIGSERDITRLGESVVKVGTPNLSFKC